ncbi:hypothetical protein HRED_02526, partial [Candidatus Haloredivivus sp. G17]
RNMRPLRVQMRKKALDSSNMRRATEKVSGLNLLYG